MILSHERRRSARLETTDSLIARRREERISTLTARRWPARSWAPSSGRIDPCRRGGASAARCSRSVSWTGYTGSRRTGPAKPWTSFPQVVGTWKKYIIPLSFLVLLLGHEENRSSSTFAFLGYKYFFYSDMSLAYYILGDARERDALTSSWKGRTAVFLLGFQRPIRRRTGCHGRRIVIHAIDASWPASRIDAVLLGCRSRGSDDRYMTTS